jgi:phage gp16-like protein
MTAARRVYSAPARQMGKSLLAKIHIAKKDLGLDDDTYRDVLEAATGKRSAAGLTGGELVAVVKHFEARGWKPSVVKGGKAGAAASGRPARRADHPVARKARALWISLHQLGVVENSSEQALEAFAKRQLGVDRLQWADQGQGFKLIEALKRMAEREADWDQSGSVEEIKARLAVLLKARADG